jgi:hypothetical protein
MLPNGPSGSGSRWTRRLGGRVGETSPGVDGEGVGTAVPLREDAGAVWAGAVGVHNVWGGGGEEDSEAEGASAEEETYRRDAVKRAEMEMLEIWKWSIV